MNNTSEHSKRLSTAAAQASLAKRFNLPIHKHMQDWEWEVADVARFEEFVAAYKSDELNDDERFSLMEILIQCVEDSAPQCIEQKWRSISDLLLDNFLLHASTVVYWAQPEETESISLFVVSTRMRTLLANRA